MRYIKTFEMFEENDIEFIIENLINNEYLLENFNFNNLKNINIKKLFDTTIDKLKNTKNTIKRQHILNVLFALYLFSCGVHNNKDFWTSDANKIKAAKISTMIENDNLSKSEIMSNFNYIKNKLNHKDVTKKYNNDILKDPLTLSSSKFIRNFIKEHEKLRLVAYRVGKDTNKDGNLDIHDGMITIGYGHAEPLKKSKYKVGDKITEHEAEILFKQDLRVAENGVKRLFKQWQEDGIDIKISQNMYDSMVSMAFNMGISGFRQSKFIQKLKTSNDHIEAASLILTSRNSGKFPGLNTRREQEANLFLKDYINNET